MQLFLWDNCYQTTGIFCKLGDHDTGSWTSKTIARFTYPKNHSQLATSRAYARPPFPVDTFFFWENTPLTKITQFLLNPTVISLWDLKKREL